MLGLEWSPAIFLEHCLFLREKVESPTFCTYLIILLWCHLPRSSIHCIFCILGVRFKSLIRFRKTLLAKTLLQEAHVKPSHYWWVTPNLFIVKWCFLTCKLSVGWCFSGSIDDPYLNQLLHWGDRKWWFPFPFISWYSIIKKRFFSSTGNEI